MNDNLALPPVFVHPQNWRVIEWIHSHQLTIELVFMVLVGWFCLSVIVGLILGPWLHKRFK